jgi:patatin-like phospholipase/acyl hydrolase
MPSFNVLSLDGGGIRGLITAVWLQRLETRLGKPLHEFFDLLAGTSTGSILACAVSAGIKTDEVVDLYQQRGAAIFPGSASRLANRLKRTFSEGLSAPKYDGRPLEEQLQRVFAERRFGSLKVRTLVTSYNTLTRDALIFKSWKSAHRDLAVWELCRASAAAPSYFAAHVLRVGSADYPLIDGGVVANNPTACAIAEACRIQTDQPEAARIPLDSFVVASFGTGASTRPIEAEEAKTWGALEWATPIVDVLFDGAADATDYIAQQLLPTTRYFRFQTNLDAAYDDLDDASSTNLNALAGVAGHYLDGEGREKLEALATLLERSRAA